MKTVTFLTALAVFLNSLASIASTDIAVVRVGYAIAAAISLVALVLQFQVSRPYVLEVSPDDWVISLPDSATFKVPARKHKKGPRALVRLEYRDADGTYITGLSSPHVEPNGDITVGVHPGAAKHHFRITVI